MSEFLTLLAPHLALDKFLAAFSSSVSSEQISTLKALNRIIVEESLAPHSLPSFTRTTVDGYALRSENSHGASASLPAYLNLIGEIPMGAEPNFELKDGQCALIHTGGMLPKGADATIMLEDTQQTKAEEIEVFKAVALGENIIQVGEDILEGEQIVGAGKLLRPAEIGALLALGVTKVTVAKRPRIGIISGGDELIPPAQKPSIGQIRDINSYTLNALAIQAGGEPKLYGIVPDDPKALSQAFEQALSECELVIITAGSSASARDHTAEVINQHGSPGVLVHGINLRPGKPTILGLCDGKAIMGLPGNPVSAYVVSELMLRPVIAKLLGRSDYSPRSSSLARLTINLASQSGREDWIPANIVEKDNALFAEPIFGKSNLIFTLVHADGLIRIPPDANGIAAGEEVQVFFI